MSVSKFPADYLERCYAGVLGKLIGVYVGRPFEGWTHQQIVENLGHVHYYVHERVDAPLVVTDDDVSGSFVFIRALEEHGATANLSAEDIGRTWLNNTIEKKSIFWWGGRGVSTEHTAYLNLKHGIKAPASGSIETNGKTVAEQIGAQIFIDGWAMIAPGNPALAAKLAEAAGSVSHDGESVYAARLWAAMEAEAFISKDVDHILDVGLEYVPVESLISKLVADVRGWAKIDGDWEKTRQRIEDIYGYDKFCGICHIIPNHGIMISTLIYAGHDFHKAMYIINTSGWDTDCNSGNIGCLVGIMHGLAAFEKGPDWRGPLGDRALISSADGGYSLNNAARITYDIVNLGCKLADEPAIRPPKDGAQYHFSLPGSVQSFIASPNSLSPDLVKIEQLTDSKSRSSLAIHLKGWTHPETPVEVLTQTFTPPEIVKMKTYDLMASPLISPGQIVTALLRADSSNTAPIKVILRLRHYNNSDTLSPFDGPSTTLPPGQEDTLTWKIPDGFDSNPIQAIGLALSCPNGHLTGTVHLESLSYSGSPHMVLKRPSAASEWSNRKKPEFWKRAWLHNLSTFHTWQTRGPFCLAQDKGEGVFYTGTREWCDYKVSIPSFQVAFGSAGVLVRVRGVNRWYAVVFEKARRRLVLVKARDEERKELAIMEFAWEMDVAYHVEVSVKESKIEGFVDGQKVLEADDEEYSSGGIGALLVEGSVLINQFGIEPCLSS